MKSVVKILLGLVGGFILLLVLAALVLPLIYDKNDLKQAIAAEVHQQTGRDLTINGALDFSVFPWVAVEVGDLTLSNAAGFGDQPFARIGKARVGVALMPLFKKQLVADEITLDGLQMSLAIQLNGKNNWDDLAKAEESKADTNKTSESAGGVFSSPRIAGLSIRDAQIEYQDQKSGSHYRLGQFNLQTGALGDSKPVDVKLSLVVEDLVAGSRSDISLATTASLDFKTENHAFDKVALTLTPIQPASGSSDTAPGRTLKINAPRVNLDLAVQSLNLETYSASLGGLEVKGSLKGRKIIDQPAFDGVLEIAEFSPRKLMQALSIEEPKTNDPDALKRAQLSAQLEGSSSQLKLSDIKLELDQSKFGGEMTVRNFERPGVRFDFDVDAIDMDRYLEPAAETSAKHSDVSLPGEELRNLDIQGSLRVGALQLAGLAFSRATIGIRLSNGKLRVNPMTAGFYDGSYSGDIMLDSSGATPVVSLDEKLDSITFQRLIADITDNENLSGTAQGHVRLTGRGATSDQVLSSLKGDLGFTLAEGALEGINIWYEIRRGYALYKGLAPPAPEPKRTVFSRMQLDAVVENGLLTTRELLGELPFLTLRGNGNINLAKSDVDLRLTATVRNAPELAKDPAAAELKGKQLPFRVSGALDDPKVTVDWAELLKSEAAGALLDKLGLKSKSEPAQAKEGEKEQLSPGDQTRDAAKGMLLDLLGGKKKEKEKEPKEGNSGG